MRRQWKWLLGIGILVIVAGGLLVGRLLTGGLAGQPGLAKMVGGTGVFASLPDLVADSDLMTARRAVQGVKGQDLRGKDFSGVSTTYMYDLTFDTQTRWPAAAKLPEGFDPARALAWGVDPGLGLRALHAQGIDGRGIAVAVFDKPIRQSHQEFTGRIHYIEVFPDNDRNKTYHFHGAATASILAGKTVGVAPGATLYYFAVPDNGQNISNYSAAMEKLFALNATLPPAERIQVVSISDGYNESMLGRADVQQWAAMIKKAEEQGIAVVHCSTVFPIRYDLTGVTPEKDRNDPDNYFGSSYNLMVPGHTRTTAGNESDSAYTYWGIGGASWVAPYLAGMVALGRQVNPAATPAQLYSAIIDTATANSKGLKVVNPGAFIQRMRK